MRLGHPHRTHLDQPHAHAAARELPCRLAAGEAGANYGYECFSHQELPDRRRRQTVIVARLAVAVNGGEPAHAASG